MSLSVEMLRREMGERRDQIARLARAEDERRTQIEEAEVSLRAQIQEAEDYLAGLKTGLGQIQTALAHERKTVEALDAAAALLSERLPSDIRARMVPPPLAPPPPRPVLAHPHDGASPVESDEDGKRTSPQYVYQRAAELDLTTVTDLVWERVEWVIEIMREAGVPLRQFEIAVQLADLLEAKRITAQGIVSDAMPILFRQGRVRAVDDASRYSAWEAVPAEVASARLGVDVDNYDGKTTRWPEGGRAPAKGTRVVVESQAFEQGKKR